jgi:hypothetical protein
MPLTTHTVFLPNAPRHTVHDVALEQAPAEIVPVPIRELARNHAESALRVLLEVMKDRDATPSTRVIAATAVLDRAWGKATPASDDDLQDAQRLETIRRIIVDPGHSDEPGLHPAPATGPV